MKSAIALPASAGIRLMAARRAAGLTQDDVARQMRVSRRTIVTIEGRLVCKPETVRRYLAALQAPEP